MDIRPEWSEKFLEKCAKADETFGWEKGAAVKRQKSSFCKCLLSN